MARLTDILGVSGVVLAIADVQDRLAKAAVSWTMAQNHGISFVLIHTTCKRHVSPALVC